MKTQINVEGIRLYAYHGCLPEETKIGGEYIVDVFMVYDFTDAALKDNLHLTIDYCSVFNICKEEMAIPSKLIETLGKRIYDRIIHAFPKLIETKVKVTKILPPMNGPVDKVSIVIED